MAVMVRVIVEGEVHELEGVKTIRDIFEKLNLPPSGYIVALNGRVVTEDEEVKPEDEVKLIEVWSGG